MSEGTWYHLDENGTPRRFAHTDRCVREPHADSRQEVALAYERLMEPYVLPPTVSKDTWKSIESFGSR